MLTVPSARTFGPIVMASTPVQDTKSYVYLFAFIFPIIHSVSFCVSVAKIILKIRHHLQHQCRRSPCHLTNNHTMKHRIRHAPTRITMILMIIKHRSSPVIHTNHMIGNVDFGSHRSHRWFFDSIFFSQQIQDIFHWKLLFFILNFSHLNIVKDRVYI